MKRKHGEAQPHCHMYNFQLAAQMPKPQTLKSIERATWWSFTQQISNHMPRVDRPSVSVETLEREPRAHASDGSPLNPKPPKP